MAEKDEKIEFNGNMPFFMEDIKALLKSYWERTRNPVSIEFNYDGSFLIHGVNDPLGIPCSAQPDIKVIETLTKILEQKLNAV